MPQHWLCRDLLYAVLDHIRVFFQLGNKVFYVGYHFACCRVGCQSLVMTPDDFASAFYRLYISGRAWAQLIVCMNTVFSNHTVCTGAGQTVLQELCIKPPINCNDRGRYGQNRRWQFIANYSCIGKPKPITIGNLT